MKLNLIVGSVALCVAALHRPADSKPPVPCDAQSSQMNQEYEYVNSDADADCEQLDSYKAPETTTCPCGPDCKCPQGPNCPASCPCFSDRDKVRGAERSVVVRRVRLFNGRLRHRLFHRWR